jgi:hypothetical protein
MSQFFIPDEAWIAVSDVRFRDRLVRFEEALGPWPAGVERVALEPYIAAVFDVVNFPPFRTALERKGTPIGFPEGRDVRAKVELLRGHGSREGSRVLFSIGGVCAVELTWEQYLGGLDVPAFHGQREGVVGISEAADWAFLDWYGEFALVGRPDYEEIADLVRVEKFRTPRGEVVSKERLVVRYRDGAVWESGRYGHAADRGAMERLERGLEWATGVRVRRIEMDPDSESEGRRIDPRQGFE